MDNGVVIPGLDEDWSLGGAKLAEWGAGFMAFIIASEFFDNVGRSMPYLLVILVTTTMAVAAVRKTFPDEERGIRNAALTAMGIEPPGIPPPAALQPYWSGAPTRSLGADCEMVRLGLDNIFPLDLEKE